MSLAEATDSRFGISGGDMELLPLSCGIRGGLAKSLDGGVKRVECEPWFGRSGTPSTASVA